MKEENKEEDTEFNFKKNLKFVNNSDMNESEILNVEELKIREDYYNILNVNKMKEESKEKESKKSGMFWFLS
tara:strand:- start:559 stop:774 length:216 start_codon:yes stop_codon:yes gene_type:complete